VEQVDLLITGASQLATPTGRAGRRGAAAGELLTCQDPAVAIRDGRVVAVGPRREVEPRVEAEVVEELEGEGVLTPGLVDPHTHLVFAGDRTAEFEQRLTGATYREIAEAGGGILSTVRHTRDADLEELVAGGRVRLRELLACGVTSVEIKSGYGLETATELRMLEAIDVLAAEAPMTIVPTFLGAHEVPPEYRGRPAAYLDLLVEEMIPAAGEQGIASYCDVFCEAHVFDVAQSRRILEAGREHGMLPKVHADELEPLGGAELAVSLEAASADHLGRISDGGIAALAAGSTVAVLLPGTTFYLDLPHRGPARRLLEAGAIVALATDCNPGSSMTTNLPLIMSLGCIQLKMTPAEALCAATLNAAAAIGLAEDKGTLEADKDADVVLWRARDYREIPYRYGTNLVERVWIAGEEVLGET
jgi:imidazolonepropionase